jgi:hypothetical protein
MELKRTIPVEIIPGVSQTRFYLDLLDPMRPDIGAVELHVAHHADGDLNEHAQWYNIYMQPTEPILQILRKELQISEDDWKVVDHMLGSFRWVIYKHTNPSEIRIDEEAMKKGEWTTTYF